MVLSRKIKMIILLLLINVLSMQAFAIDPVALDQKLDKIIKKDLKLENFTKEQSVISHEQFEKAGIGLHDQIFKLTADGYKGFYIIEQAMGRFHDFTYVVFFSKDLEIQLIRVVEYGEEHGVEITQKKWLQQFIGKTPNDQLIFKKNIDAISGATISGTSITESIDRLLRYVSILREYGII